MRAARATPSPAAPRRSDAVLRRTALLEAATAVFVEQGMSAPLDTIAARAGVGQATFYRNFPDRAALLSALVDAELAALERAIAAVEPAELPLTILDTIADRLVESPTLSEFWRTTAARTSSARAARARFVALVEPAVKAAVRAGQVRPDLRATDLPLLSSMLGAILCGKDESERRSLRPRVMSLLLEGLRPREKQTKKLVRRR